MVPFLDMEILEAWETTTLTVQKSSSGPVHGVNLTQTSWTCGWTGGGDYREGLAANSLANIVVEDDLRTRLVERTTEIHLLGTSH